MIAPSSRLLAAGVLASALASCAGGQGIPTPQDASANRVDRTQSTAPAGNASGQTAPAVQAQTSAGDAKAAPKTPVVDPSATKPGGSIGQTSHGTDLTTTPLNVVETFAGTGTLGFVDQTYDVAQKTTISTTPTTLVVQLTQASSSNGDVNGGLQSSLGSTTFARVDAAAGNIPIAQRFLLFTNSVAGSAGKTTFSVPIPVFAFPGSSQTRYSALDGGQTLSFSAHATGPAGQSFTVNVTVAKTAASGNSVGIQIKAQIPEDTDGTLYALIGLSASSTEAIDLTAQRVVSMSTDQFYHTDKTPGNPFDQVGMPGFAPPELQQQAQQMSNRQPMHIDYKLCTYQGPDGKTQQVGGC